MGTEQDMSTPPVVTGTPARRRLSPARAAVLLGVLMSTVVAAHSTRVGADSNEGTTNKGSHSVVTAGYGHTCVVVETAAKCWGANAYGQLGNNSTTDSYSVQEVSGLSSGVTAIAAGGWHNCALTTSGGVKCWGRNTYGQLGNGATLDQKRPVSIDTLGTDVTAISGGSYHTCALTVSGGIKCWGANSYGQLGNAATASAQTTPVSVVAPGIQFVSVSAGDSHTCALTSAGEVMCWGRGHVGQLGTGAMPAAQKTPVGVPAIGSRATAVTVGDLHTCALLDDATVRCWGAGSYGRLGHGASGNELSPVAVQSSPIISVAAGGFHTCAVTSSGTALCWGLRAAIGDGTTADSDTPVAVIDLPSGVTAVVAGWKHSCGISQNQLKCWGYNFWGQLGTGGTGNCTSACGPIVSIPAPVPTTAPPGQGTLVAGGPVSTIASPTTVKSTTTTKPPSASKSPTTTSTKPPTVGVPIVTTVPAAKAGTTTTVSGAPAVPPDSTPADRANEPEDPEDNVAPEPPTDELIERLPEPYPPIGPVPPGIGVDIQVPGLTPGETVDCWWLDKDGKILADLGPVDCGTAGDDGSFRATVPVPPGAGGKLTLVAIGRTSGKGIRQVVQVDEGAAVATPSGSSSKWWIILLIAAVSVLIWFLVARRRRDEEEEQTT